MSDPLLPVSTSVSSSPEEVAAAIPDEIRRLRQLGSKADIQPTAFAARIRASLCGTILPMIADLATEMAGFRSWAVDAISSHSEHLDDHEARFEALESVVFGDGTRLSQEDADLFSKVTSGARVFAQETLKTDPGNEFAKGLLELCQAADGVIESSTIQFDDDSEDEDEDEESGAL